METPVPDMHKSERSDAHPTCLFAVGLPTAGGHRCFMHTHACTEIVWYRGCAGWLPQGPARLRYEDGHIAVCQPGVGHGDECERSGEQFCVGVTGCGADGLPAGVWNPDAATVAALAQLRAEVDRHDPWSQGRLDLLSGRLVLELRRQLRAHGPNETREPYHVTAARKIFDTRFAEPLTVAAVAADLAIHPDYLRQLFNKTTGETPIRYLIRKRLECACDLLRLNQEPVQRIAARAGIHNPYYFSRLFRDRFGLSPKEYRARYTQPPPG